MENKSDLNNKNWSKLVLSREKIAILKRRGFYGTSSSQIDDHFYTDDYALRRNSFLGSGKSIRELIDLSCEDMEAELFCKDSVYPQEVCIDSREKPFWRYFDGSKLFYDVQPDLLDPYIAHYVRAINRCGIRTFFSCDGWHESRDKSKRAFIAFDGRYGRIWHKILCEHIISPEKCHWEYEADDAGGVAVISLPVGDEGKRKVYRRIAKTAKEFDRNSFFFQLLKIVVIPRLDRFSIDGLPDSGVEEMMRREVTKVFNDLFDFELIRS